MASGLLYFGHWGILLSELLNKNIFGTWKMKIDFLCNEHENFLCKHCLPFQVAPVCTIWNHTDKYSILKAMT
jgi:hypothetical protein